MLKKLLVVSCLLLTLNTNVINCFALESSDHSPTIATEGYERQEFIRLYSSYAYIYDPEKKLVFVKRGYINDLGLWIIPPQYRDGGYNTDFFEPTSMGYRYPACLDEKWGFLNFNSEWPVQPQYDYIEDFSSDRALVRKDGIYRFVDPAGKEMIVFPEGTESTSFCDGVAVISDPLDADTLKVINVYGKEIFQIKNAHALAVPRGKRVTFCTESMFPVFTDEKWGFVDKTGRWIISPRFDEVQCFSEGLAAAKTDGKWGYIDKTGKWVIYPQFDEVHVFSESLAGVLSNETWKFIDREGNCPFPKEFQNWDEITMSGENMNEHAYLFREGLSGAYNGEKWGYIDQTGAWAIAPQFTGVYPFQDGLASVKIYNTVGYIQKTGISISNTFSGIIHSVF